MIPLLPWTPPGGRFGFDSGKVTDAAPRGELAPTVCAGYSCSLPEVIETARARMHWEKGQLEAFTGGAPTDRLVRQIEIVDSQYHLVQLWKVTPRSKGGGRED